MDQRKTGFNFTKDGDSGEHRLSVNVKTINAAYAFFIQLVALLGLLWTIFTWRVVPLIDGRIEAKTHLLSARTEANAEWIIAHKAEVASGLKQMETFRIETEKDRDELLVELRYIRERLDYLYERARK